MRRALLLLAACTMLDTFTAAADRPNSGFGPSNPFYAESSLPFHAPPFDKIKDADYQPAIEAGMGQQLAEVRAVAVEYRRTDLREYLRAAGEERAPFLIVRCRHSQAWRGRTPILTCRT